MSPAITYAASGSVVSKVTSTDSVKGATVISPASSTSSPLIWKLEKVTSLPSATIRVTTYSSVVILSAAVTVTTTRFSPATRSSAPATVNVASASSVSTITSADVVYGSRL